MWTNYSSFFGVNCPINDSQQQVVNFRLIIKRPKLRYLSVTYLFTQQKSSSNSSDQKFVTLDSDDGFKLKSSTALEDYKLRI